MYGHWSGKVESVRTAKTAGADMAYVYAERDEGLPSTNALKLYRSSFRIGQISRLTGDEHGASEGDAGGVDVLLMHHDNILTEVLLYR
jgi:hypothetical protein